MVVDDIGSVRGFVGFDRSPSRIPANQIQRLMDDEAIRECGLPGEWRG
jgi:hypothetical protein